MRGCFCVSEIFEDFLFYDCLTFCNLILKLWILDIGSCTLYLVPCSLGFGSSTFINVYMKKLPCLFIIALLISGLSFSQPANTIKGKVTNAVSGVAIPNCSVFITGTSKGTVSNLSGEFELMNVPQGTYELVISCIGYQTFVYTYKTGQLPLQLDVQLKLKEEELTSVVIEPFDKNGWEKWGKYFVDNFIGTTDNAKDCKIINREVLRFRFSERNDRLTVISDEPLIIENNALGYTIQYQLEKFSSDFDKRIVSYFGYPLFREMVTESKRRKQRWELNRKRAYLGSITHFIQCLNDNQLQQQGFEARKVAKIFNTEKRRVEELYRNAAAVADTFQLSKEGIVKINKDAAFPKDSIAYYKAVLAKPDYYERQFSLTADSLVFAKKDGTKYFFSPDRLTVVYSNAKENKNGRSEIYLVTPAPVAIEKNGNYYPPQEIMTFGYWAVYEKIANELPFDYVPDKLPL